MNVLCTHPPLSPAVQRCCDARNQMIERDRNTRPEELPQLPEDYDTNLQSQFKFQTESMIFLHALDAELAYRTAMPEPVGRRNIKNFIACVTHGMCIGAIEPQEGKNLLYAARTATLAISKYKDRKKQPAKAPALTEYELYQIESQKLLQNRGKAAI
jgi:hypothetical protein